MGNPQGSKNCTLTRCNCNCCNKARDQHCGEHGNRCHVRCPY